jgi:hypothetical protein
MVCLQEETDNVNQLNFRMPEPKYQHPEMHSSQISSRPIWTAYSKDAINQVAPKFNCQAPPKQRYFTSTNSSMP